jgi:DNA-binding response OmpR family regulator
MIPKEILAVNDGAPLLQAVGGLFATRNYRFSLTDSPEDALVLLNTRDFHLVVMKINGKQIDRLSVMHMVKELNPGTKLVILADKAHPPVEIFEIMADDYILLPCRLMEIWRRLVNCLEPSSRRPAVFRENRLMYLVNQQIFKNLGLLFQEMQDQAFALADGWELLNLELDGRLDRELEVSCQAICEHTRTLKSMTEELSKKLL